MAEGAQTAPESGGSRLDPYCGVIDDWLRSDLDAPRKQRHTAKRIFDRLLDEHHATDVSYWMVREYVATRRGEIRIEAGREPAATFVPQEHLPGREAEVDFAETPHQHGTTMDGQPGPVIQTSRSRDFSGRRARSQAISYTDDAMPITITKRFHTWRHVNWTQPSRRKHSR